MTTLKLREPLVLTIIKLESEFNPSPSACKVCALSITPHCLFVMEASSNRYLLNSHVIMALARGLCSLILYPSRLVRLGCVVWWCIKFEFSQNCFYDLPVSFNFCVSGGKAKEKFFQFPHFIFWEFFLICMICVENLIMSLGRGMFVKCCAQCWHNKHSISSDY